MHQRGQLPLNIPGRLFIYVVAASIGVGNGRIVKGIQGRFCPHGPYQSHMPVRHAHHQVRLLQKVLGQLLGGVTFQTQPPASHGPPGSLGGGQTVHRPDTCG